MSATYLPKTVNLSGWLSGLILAMTLAPAHATAAETRHAAMVIDANTGQVLYELYADAPRRPASLTKMMTVYLAFEQIEQKRLDYSTKITVSDKAASVAPSKLDLKPGEEIEFIDAIKALITKSANDMAVAIAERIGGSEVGFVRLMNERARQIGMRSTVFTNASGLPNPRQITTARDMLTLALRLKDDFPAHFRLFSLKSFEYRGKTYRTHNTLMHGFPGMDGIKTGYTRASGFNLVSSVRIGDKHLVAAVFGGATASARNAHMRLLLFRALEKASTQVTRRSEPHLLAASAAESAATVKLPPIIKEQSDTGKAEASETKKPPAPPKPKPALAKKPAQKPEPVAVAMVPPAPTTAPPAPAAAEEAKVQQPAAAPATVTRLDLQALREAMSTEASASATSSPPASIEDIITSSTGAAAQEARKHAEGEDQIARLAREHVTSDEAGSAGPSAQSNTDARPASTLDKQAETLSPSPEPVTANASSAATADSKEPAPRPRLAAAPLGSGYEIQIGAYSTAAEAESRLTGAVTRAGGLLEGHTPVALPVQKGDHQIFRARFTRFDESAASKVCQQLLKLSIDCFVMRAE